MRTKTPAGFARTLPLYQEFDSSLDRVLIKALAGRRKSTEITEPVGASRYIVVTERGNYLIAFRVSTK